MRAADIFFDVVVILLWRCG